MAYLTFTPPQVCPHCLSPYYITQLPASTAALFDPSAPNTPLFHCDNCQTNFTLPATVSINIGASPSGPTGPGGGTGGYHYVQATPVKHWIIVHNLGLMPDVVVVDAAGFAVMGEISYPNLDTVSIWFSVPFAGQAYLN